jgi:hypothetical protein
VVGRAIFFIWSRGGASAAIIALAAQFCLAQDPGFEWVRAVSGSFGFGSRSIAVDTEGDLYAIGYFQDTLSFSAESGETAIVSAGGIDIFIIKISSSGSLLWAKPIGGPRDDYGFSIAIDGQGDIYTAGFFEDTVDFDPGPDTFLLASAGLFDAFVLKMDADGAFLWARPIQGSNNEMAYAICADEEGNAYTTGWFAGNPDFNPGSDSSILISAGLADVFIQKLDSEGNFQWAKSFGGESSDEGFAICHDAAGNVYTTGAFYSLVDFDPGPQSSILSSQGERDIFVQKLDPDGNFLWAKSFGGPRDDYGYSIGVDHADQVYVAGSYYDSIDFGPGTPPGVLTSAGGADILVLKLDGAGNTLWAKSMGGPSEDEGRSVYLDSSGNAYVTGYFRGEADFGPDPGTHLLTSAGVWDVFVQKLDKTGNSLWAKSFGGHSNDKGYAACIDDANSVYVSGFFEGTVDFNPGTGAAILSTEAPSGFLYKMSQEKQSSTTRQEQRDSLFLFPNPSSGAFQIDLGHIYKDISLKITDAEGKAVYKRQYKDRRYLSIELPQQPPGVYFVEALTENKALAGKLLVQE